jgi:hypothetical protein
MLPWPIAVPAQSATRSKQGKATAKLCTAQRIPPFQQPPLMLQFSRWTPPAGTVLDQLLAVLDTPKKGAVAPFFFGSKSRNVHTAR